MRGWRVQLQRCHLASKEQAFLGRMPSFHQSPLLPTPAFLACRERGVIVLRPIRFRERDSHFLLLLPKGAASSKAGSAVDLTCLRVPQHLQKLSWAQLLVPEGRQGLTEQLVLHSSPVTAVLSQFESSCFIHTYLCGSSSCSSGGTSDGSSCSDSNGSRGSDGSSGSEPSAAAPTMLFSLPRFGLEFELRGGSLWSQDFTGCRLRACQRLVEPPADDNSTAIYTLPDFSHYLVLERSGQQGGSSAALQVLVPAGRVQRGPEAVAVVHSGDTDAQLEVSKRGMWTTGIARQRLQAGQGRLRCFLRCSTLQQLCKQPACCF